MTHLLHHFPTVHRRLTHQLVARDTQNSQGRLIVPNDLKRWGVHHKPIRQLFEDCLKYIHCVFTSAQISLTKPLLHFAEYYAPHHNGHQQLHMLLPQHTDWLRRDQPGEHWYYQPSEHRHRHRHRHTNVLAVTAHKLTSLNTHWLKCYLGLARHRGRMASSCSV